jgi:hypothetical protein
MDKNNDSIEYNLLTQKEAAAMIRMSESWFERQRWEKKGIPYIKIGGRVFYDKLDLVSWVKDKKVN